MRQNNQNKQNQQRARGRGRGKPQNPLTRNYDSNGPDVKVRGNAQHIADKYQQLARDAQSAGDAVLEQSYLQHAEHYLRLIAASHGNQSTSQRSSTDNANREPQSAPVESSTPAKSTDGNGVDSAVMTNTIPQSNGTSMNNTIDESISEPQTKNQDEMTNLNVSEDNFTATPASAVPSMESNRAHTPRGRGVRRVAVARDRNESSISPTAN